MKQEADNWHTCREGQLKLFSESDVLEPDNVVGGPWWHEELQAANAEVLATLDTVVRTLKALRPLAVRAGDADLAGMVDRALAEAAALELFTPYADEYEDE